MAIDYVWTGSVSEYKARRAVSRLTRGTMKRVALGFGGRYLKIHHKIKRRTIK